MNEPGLPTGTVTFLFTDIEGSTRRWEENSEAMGASLAAHDEVLRSAIARHGGRLFKHTGDGVCAVFSSARAAVDAAMDAQRALVLPVRMGLATGEAELRGGDYFGPVLNRTARVMAAGHGGQILLAAATAALVDQSLLMDLGRRQLRDLSEPVPLFQVVADGLRTQFPPLRTLDTLPGNLRAPATTFVGREREVAELIDTVKTHRLVTLTGVGGVGKTRLALRVAAELAGDFGDGVWVVELAPVGDPAAVPDAVAAALGVIQHAGLTLTETIAQVLDGRHRLLVLDNCEHVLDAAADLIDAVAHQATTVHILTTSREGLRVPGEHLWPVPSLEVSNDEHSAAAALFRERATAVGFTPSSQADLDAIVDICRRLDGIPLAIELAASRLVSMSVSDLRDRLGDRFRLLAGARRGLERHQTLRHAVQWSYDLLSDGERNVLNRCSVFAGGFDLSAAVAVAGDGRDHYDMLDLLDSLVRKSLLTVDRTSGPTRYGMLETIRQFAEDQLAASGHADDVRDAHACYFAGCHDEIMATCCSPRQRDAYQWVERELANLRVAFRWAHQRGDLDSAATIVVYTGFIGEGLAILEPTLWALEIVEAVSKMRHRKLLALCAVTAWSANLGRVEESERWATLGESLLGHPSFEDLPFDTAAVAFGAPKAQRGRFDLWVELCRAGISRADGRYTTCDAGFVLGLAVSGRAHEARPFAEDLIERAEQTNTPYNMVFAAVAAATAVRDVDPDRARAALRRGLALAHEVGIRTYEGAMLIDLARLECDGGDVATAFACVEQSIALFLDMASVDLVRCRLAVTARLLARSGHHESAVAVGASAECAMTAVVEPALAVTMDQLRAQLGADDFERLYAQGRAMTPAEAVRFALAEIATAKAAL